MLLRTHGILLERLFLDPFSPYLLVRFHLIDGELHCRQDIRNRFEQWAGKNVHEAVLGVSQLNEVAQLWRTTKKCGRDANILFHHTLISKFKLKNIGPFDGDFERTCLIQHQLREDGTHLSKRTYNITNVCALDK